MSIIQFAFIAVSIIKEIRYSLHSLISNLKDEIFKLFYISVGKLSRMRVDSGDESRGGLVKVGV